MEDYIKIIVHILVMVGLGFMFGNMMKQKREEAIEKDVEYYEKSLKRLEDEQKQGVLF